MSNEPQVEEKKGGANITEYLQAPSKKRKNYVIMALGENFNRSVSSQIEGFVGAKYKHLAVSHPRSPRELKRQFGRNISLLILDDEFSELDEVLNLVEVLKGKRKSEAIPVLFLTQNPERLIRRYREVLSVFHEVDDYCHYTALEQKQIIGRIRCGLDNKNRRKSRRYKVDIGVSFYHLTENKIFQGQLIDLSIHGAVIRAKDLEEFHLGDQIKISLPISRFLSAENGEYMSVSARVRRVLISGSVAAISFEYMSDTTQHRLMSFLTALVSYQLNFKSN